MNNIKNKLKIVIAPDSFKGSISAEDAAAAIELGLRKGAPDGISLETVKLPIADGGEGTLDALVPPPSQRCVYVTGTNGKRLMAKYGTIGDVAVIEMARAAGLTLSAPSERCAATATTYGVGELILHALECGHRSILLTVGGSGTNDGGCGMLSALGARFIRADGSAFIPTGGTLSQIRDVDLSELDQRLRECTFTVATDVTNPLCGELGATYVYGRQKGADDGELSMMESGMLSYARLLEEKSGKNVADIAGCGAGGGLAAPLLAFCDARICSGIHAVIDATGLQKHVSDADAVITGEGKIDVQSLYGKAISGVAESAARYGVPVYCLVGCIGGDKDELLSLGIADILSLSDIAPDAEYSMSHAAELLTSLAETLIKAQLI